MVALRFLALALTFWRALAAEIQLPEGIAVRTPLNLPLPPPSGKRQHLTTAIPQVEEFEEIPADPAGKAQTPNLNIDIKAFFPDSEVFGVKLVNGHATRCVVDITNHEPQPVALQFILGSLLTLAGAPGAPDPPVIVRNLTQSRYGVQIPAGESESITYSFATELHPQDLTLALMAILQSSEGAIYTNMLFNETVSIVEAPVSLFDPQMYVLSTGSIRVRIY